MADARPQRSDRPAGDTERHDTASADPSTDASVPPPRRRPRRARRAATNPRTDDSPDVPAPREAPPEGEDARARWFREQRPPHWD